MGRSMERQANSSRSFGFFRDAVLEAVAWFLTEKKWDV